MELTFPLSEAIGVISSELRLRFADTNTPLGFVSLATLRHLARHGTMSVSDLAKVDRVTTQAISLRIAPLVEAGLLIRSPDPADARRILLRVTDDGTELLSRARNGALEALDEALRTLDEKDHKAIEQAMPALERIGRAMRAGSKVTDA